VSPAAERFAALLIAYLCLCRLTMPPFYIFFLFCPVQSAFFERGRVQQAEQWGKMFACFSLISADYFQALSISCRTYPDTANAFIPSGYFISECFLALPFML